MKHYKRLNILSVAAISAAVNWTIAMMFVLLLLPMMVSLGALPGSFEAAVSSDRMVFVVVVPFVFAVLCFGLGALMAVLYNMFVQTLVAHRHVAVSAIAEPELKVEGATVGDAA